MLPNVRALPIVATEADHRGILWERPVGRRLESALQHRPDPANSGNSPASKRTDSSAFADEVGSDSILVESPFYRDRHDQREIGNSRDEACFSRSSEASKVPDPR